MKKNLFPVMSLLALLLSACSSEQVPSKSAAFTQIYTSVAIKVNTETNFVTSTATPILTSTPTSTSTPFTTSSPAPTSVAYAHPNTNSIANGCPNAAYMRDITIPDGAKLAPGQTFVKTWKFENTGSCPWRKKYSIVFRRGDDMGGSDSEIEKVIDPGHEAKISISLTAPNKEGTYTGYWMLADAGGNAFGNEVSVRIVVSNDAAASGPTARATP